MKLVVEVECSDWRGRSPSMRETQARYSAFAAALRAIADRLQVGGSEGAATFERPTKAGDLITVNFNLDYGEEDAAAA